MSTPLTSLPDGVALAVKVVPGASRTRVAGMLGDRLKVTLAAPPEAGKANRALLDLLAELFAVPVQNIRITAGQSQPLKRVEILGVSLCAASERLSKQLAPAS